MYYQNYEDYMRSVLGYPAQSRQNTYETTYEMQYMPDVTYVNPSNYNREMLDLYPEIYQIVNPMVCKICESNTKPLTRELLESMTDEIYSNLESDPKMDTVVNVRVSTQAPSSEKSNRVSSSSSSTSSCSSSISNSTTKSYLFLIASPILVFLLLCISFLCLAIIPQLKGSLFRQI